jgi:hypothetical protein
MSARSVGKREIAIAPNNVPALARRRRSDGDLGRLFHLVGERLLYFGLAFDCAQCRRRAWRPLGRALQLVLRQQVGLDLADAETAGDTIGNRFRVAGEQDAAQPHICERRDGAPGAWLQGAWYRRRQSRRAAGRR